MGLITIYFKTISAEIFGKRDTDEWETSSSMKSAAGSDGKQPQRYFESQRCLFRSQYILACLQRNREREKRFLDAHRAAFWIEVD